MSKHLSCTIRSIPGGGVRVEIQSSKFLFCPEDANLDYAKFGVVKEVTDDKLVLAGPIVFEGFAPLDADAADEDFEVDHTDFTGIVVQPCEGHIHMAVYAEPGTSIHHVRDATFTMASFDDDDGDDCSGMGLSVLFLSIGGPFSNPLDGSSSHN